jgi:hypothetical protein
VTTPDLPAAALRGINSVSGGPESLLRPRFLERLADASAREIRTSLTTLLASVARSHDHPDPWSLGAQQAVREVAEGLGVDWDAVLKEEGRAASTEGPAL